MESVAAAPPARQPQELVRSKRAADAPIGQTLYRKDPVARRQLNKLVAEIIAQGEAAEAATK